MLINGEMWEVFGIERWSQLLAESRPRCCLEASTFFILSVKGLHGHWIECGGEYLNRENRFAGPNHIIKNIKIIILYLIKE